MFEYCLRRRSKENSRLHFGLYVSKTVKSQWKTTNVDRQLKKMMKKSQIRYDQIALDTRQIRVSYGLVQYIMEDDLRMRRLCAKFV